MYLEATICNLVTALKENGYTVNVFLNLKLYKLILK